MRDSASGGGDAGDEMRPADGTLTAARDGHESDSQRWRIIRARLVTSLGTAAALYARTHVRTYVRMYLGSSRFQPAEARNKGSQWRARRFPLPRARREDIPNAIVNFSFSFLCCLNQPSYHASLSLHPTCRLHQKMTWRFARYLQRERREEGARRGSRRLDFRDGDVLVRIRDTGRSAPCPPLSSTSFVRGSSFVSVTAKFTGVFIVECHSRRYVPWARRIESCVLSGILGRFSGLRRRFLWKQKENIAMSKNREVQLC